MSMLHRKKEEHVRAADLLRSAGSDAAGKPVQPALHGPQQQRQPIEPLPSTPTPVEGPVVPCHPLPPASSYGPVFSINFVRRQTTSLRVRRALAYCGLGYLVVNVMIFMTFIGMAIQSHQQAYAVRVQSHAQRSSSAAVSASRQEMASLQQRALEQLNQLNAIIALQKQRFPVAGKLAALTKTIPARTWITSLSGQRNNRTMTIQAAYLVNPDAPYTLPATQWIEALRADPAFRQSLKRLDLGASTRKTLGSTELFVFDLVAEWDAPATPEVKP